jgi:septum formation protein
MAEYAFRSSGNRGDMRLVLASGSPRRSDLLANLGVVFSVSVPEVDETRRPGEDPHGYVERLAREKGLAVAAPGAVTVGADTVVVMDGVILGKPGHPAEARRMLDSLQGTRHEVVTGIAVVDGERIVSSVDSTEVMMLPMTESEISDYIDTGEPMDKAGAYALQGRAGRFIASVHGSPFTVVGLPIHLLDRLLAALGHDLRHFTSATPPVP